MILQCPSCSARFLVADALIPPQGRTVKCGNCANQWHVDAPENPAPDFAAMAAEAAASAEAATPALSEQQQRQLPVIAARTVPLRPFMIAAPVLAVTWFLVAFYAYFPSWIEAPGVGGIYRMLGVRTTHGLVFADVSMERIIKEGRTQFLISGSIANHDPVGRTVPGVRVQLKDKEGNIISSREYDVNLMIASGGIYPFRITNIETSFADKVGSIVLDLGHPLELMMR